MQALSRYLKRLIAWLGSLRFEEDAAVFAEGLPATQVLPRYASESSAPRRCSSCGESVEFLPDIELAMCPYCGNRLETKW